VTARILLPLTVSVFLLAFLIRISPSILSDHDQTDRLYQTVKDYTADEVVQAVANEYTSSFLVSSLEAVSDGVAEHLKGDHFIKEALMKQMESSEIVDMDFEEILSGLNENQTEKLLSGLREREML
jgi:hypothetical protein